MESPFLRNLSDGTAPIQPQRVKPSKWRSKIVYRVKNLIGRYFSQRNKSVYIPGGSNHGDDVEIHWGSCMASRSSCTIISELQNSMRVADDEYEGPSSNATSAPDSPCFTEVVDGQQGTTAGTTPAVDSNRPPEHTDDEAEEGRAEDAKINLEDSISSSESYGNVSGGFTYPAHVVANPAEKKQMIVALDTQASANLIRTKVCERMNLQTEPCHVILSPLQSASEQQTEIVATRIARNVPWHWDGCDKTYTTDFLVVDMKQFDAILGGKDIAKHGFLRPDNMPNRNSTFRF